MNNKSSNKWFIFPKPNPAATLRLFCFHYAGGSAQVFQSWPGHLPPSVEIGAIQLPGRGHRLSEPYIKQMFPITQDITQELLPYFDKPFVFFGHSLGALLCFETARSLRRWNQCQPAHLFISAIEAPHQRSREKLLSNLPKKALVQKLRDFGGTPPEILQNDEVLDMMLPMIRTDFELCEAYEYYPETLLNCPMTIYGGIEDYKVEAKRLAAWREMTTGTCKIRMFPGGHFYLNSLRSGFMQTFASDLLRLFS